MTSTFGCSDIYDFMLSSLTSRCERKGVISRVEFHKTIVVPQDSVALATDEHGDGDLGVHLCKTPREASDIGKTILELSESIEVLIIR